MFDTVTPLFRVPRDHDLMQYSREHCRLGSLNIRGVAEGGPDRAQVHPNVGYALPTLKIEKDRNTLIEQSNTLNAVTNTGCALPLLKLWLHHCCISALLMLRLAP